MWILSVVIFIVCVLLGLFVLAQNPKGGGLAQGFTGAQQIGGVQKTANFLEKGTWSLATLLLVLCLVSAASLTNTGVQEDEFDAPIVAPAEYDPNMPIEGATEVPGAPATPSN